MEKKRAIKKVAKKKTPAKPDALTELFTVFEALTPEELEAFKLELQKMSKWAERSKSNRK